jgi:hypothetical protein
MVSINKSAVDDIIKNWFPVIGILFVVAGMSYLFYEGVWQKLNEPGRLILGFLAGVAMISGSYALEKASKIIADAVLGGGLLMLYLSLIFGSRFQTGNVQALIPETWALLIATLFTFGVAFFSYTRRSQYILLVGILGGYLTPFFIGETGGLKQFMDDTGVFHYNLPLTAFLIYFAAINIAVLFVASRFFLRGIGVLNSLGLFVGTLSLFYFMGGKFPANAFNIAAFMILVVALHIGAMCINAKKFAKETDPYLLAGYLLPLVWFAAGMNSFLEHYIDYSVLAVLLLGCAAIYFGGWHYMRRTLDRAQHNALYIGGVIAVILALTKLHPELNHLDGPVLALVAIVFGVLYCITPLPQREMSYFIFAGFGFLVTLWHIDKMSMHDLGVFRGTTLVIVFSLLPFLLGTLFPERDDEHRDVKAFRSFAYYAAGVLIFLLMFLDLVREEDIPRSFLFFTLPAAITCYLSYSKADEYFKFWIVKSSLALAAAGFFTTFMTMIDRFSPFPPDVKAIATGESVVGFSTIAILLLLGHNVKKLARAEQQLTDVYFGAVWQFILTFFVYLSIWATLTHEIMALFNTLNLAGEGVRNFATTIWWVCLGAFMIFIGVKNSLLVNQKNIGFGLLSLTIFKILMIDLYYLNTNFKIFVFLLVGLLMLYISYVANKKSAETDNPGEVRD